MSDKLKLEDYEQALRAVSSQLYIMYEHNGGDAAQKTTLQHLKCIDSITIYLQELASEVVEASELLPPEKAKSLLEKIQPVIDVLKDKGETSNGNEGN